MSDTDVAACSGEDPELWFPTSERRRAKAVALCDQCAIKQNCLDHALKHQMKFGIWGGLDEDERSDLQKPPRSRAARPKKRKPSGRPVPPPSDVRGVSWNSWKGHWVVTIRHGGAMHWVGGFADQKLAEAAAIAKCAELGTSTQRSRTGKRAA